MQGIMDLVLNVFHHTALSVFFGRSLLNSLGSILDFVLIGVLCFFDTMLTWSRAWRTRWAICSLHFLGDSLSGFVTSNGIHKNMLLFGLHSIFACFYVTLVVRNNTVVWISCVHSLIFYFINKETVILILNLNWWIRLETSQNLPMKSVGQFHIEYIKWYDSHQIFWHNAWKIIVMMGGFCLFFFINNSFWYDDGDVCYRAHGHGIVFVLLL